MDATEAPPACVYGVASSDPAADPTGIPMPEPAYGCGMGGRCLIRA